MKVYMQSPTKNRICVFVSRKLLTDKKTGRVTPLKTHVDVALVNVGKPQSVLSPGFENTANTFLFLR